MKTSIGTHFARLHWIALLGAIFTTLFSPPLAAQQPAAGSVAVQHEAMQKLSFLAGRWSGPITVFHGPGTPVHLTQTENIEYKLDGTVLLIEGKSTDADGKVAFSALATISYDDGSHTYRMRAYHDGRYVDAELAALENGFSWGFASGPAQVMNTMHLTPKGEWSEVTEVTVGNNPPQHGVEMLLQHQQ
jgi:hypothetical protein